MADDVVQFAVRQAGNQQAIILVHGFHGNSHQTFGMLPAFLAGNPSFYSWDIHCFGYPSGLAPDITGVWSADPDLTTLSGYLTTSLSSRFGAYQRVAIIAHSMGGLIVQRSLLDGDFQNRLSHVLLFGTPSDGLRKAGLGRLFKRQARDMTADGPFVTNLRQDWTKRFPGGLPFAFRAVAGVRDEFVPTNSSVMPFAPQFRSYVAGNHLEMVKPQTVDGDTTLLLVKELSPAAIPATVPSGQQTIETRLANVDRLGESELVDLTFALEMSGRQAEAIEMLKTRHAGNTELTGVYAGRLKRLWLGDPVSNSAEGPEAQRLYASAFRQADSEGNHAQALYNGINAAFMALALTQSRYDARLIAVKVLDHCKQAKRDKWRLATEGEAALYLGETDIAIDSYAAALDEGPNPREVDSIHKQAIWAARLLKDAEAEARLDKLFDQTR